MTAQKKNHLSSGFAQTVCSTAAACLLSATLLVSSVAAFELSDFPPDEPEEKIIKIDPKKCSISTALVKQWISNNSLTAKLSEAYLKLLKDWDKLDNSKFGHATATNISTIRNEARIKVDNQRKELFRIAIRIQANLIPACDKCRLKDLWGKLKYIAIKKDINKFGVYTTEIITQRQMHDKHVARAVNEYLIFYNMRNSFEQDYPVKASDTDRRTMNAACRSEFINNKDDMSKIDATKCVRSYAENILDNIFLPKIGEKLEVAYKSSDNKKMSELSDVECESSILSPYNFIKYLSYDD